MYAVIQTGGKQYKVTPGEEVRVEKLKEKPFSGQIDWVAYEESYFMTAIINETNNKATVRGTILPEGEAKISYIAPQLSLGQNQNTTVGFTLYLGPRDLYILKPLGKNLENLREIPSDNNQNEPTRIKFYLTIQNFFA